MNPEFAPTTGPVRKSEADSKIYGANRAEESQRDVEPDGRRNPRKMRGVGGGDLGRAKSGSKGVAARLLLGGLVACSDAPSPVSSDMSSRDITITVAVDGTAARTRLTGSVRTPSAGVRFVEGDQLRFVTDTLEGPVSLTQSAFALDLPPYGGPVVVRLSRPEGRGGDVVAEARVASPFRIDAPASARLGAPITLVWEGGAPRDITTTLGVTGPCIAPQSRPLTFDAGTYTFNAGELERRGAAPPCAVTVTVVKKLASATQTATRTFEVSP